ncbi:hypothetical protein [Sphingomonas corticis]|uniref:Uncharacterized protein n=1 Tax=Sphingomonas corticis TaxID=2722791 RepID=A0ABX1CWC5_9SPHN|nr:hypothetical protein [Sphingomonas corticis]NJR80707.1 hypothetical protein [Sphingomonas corticis]
MLINDAIAIARADMARVERFIRRRDSFLDALDWHALPDTAAFEASMLDDLLDDDLADSASYVAWLEELAAEGVTALTHMLRFDPHCRPRHADRDTPSLTFAPARTSIAS